MTYKEYEIIVEKLEEKLECGLITESTAEAINSYCYNKYMESYVDEMCDALDDEYDESTRLSREIYNGYEDKLKKLKDEKSKVDAQIKAMEKSSNAAVKEGSSYEKSTALKLAGLRNTSKRLREQIDDITYNKRPDGDTKYLGLSKHDWGNTHGIKIKKRIRKEYDTEPAAAPREPGTYKKLQDKMRNEK